MAMVRSETSTQVRHDPDTTWRLLLDWKDHERWVPLTRVVVHDENRFTAYTGIGPFALRDEMQVLECDDATMRCRVAKLGPVLKGYAEFAVATSGQGACVVWIEDVRVPYLPRVLAPVAAYLTGLAFRRSLRAL